MIQCLRHSGKSMHHATSARNELGPLMDQLIVQLEQEGCATQKAHFKRIRGHLYGANDPLSVTQSIIALSNSVALGFRFSNTADALVSRILSKTANLVQELEGTQPIVH